MSRVCPKDGRPCCDDLCHGSECLQMDGTPMLEICFVCNGTIDSESMDGSTCTCDPDDDFIEGEAP